MALYINSVGNDRFATLATVRRLLGLSLGEANNLLAHLPSEITLDDPSKKDLIVGALRSIGVDISESAPDRQAPAQVEQGFSAEQIEEFMKELMPNFGEPTTNPGNSHAITDNGVADVVNNVAKAKAKVNKPARNAGAGNVKYVTITKVGGAGMKLVRVLKEELRMSFGDAAGLAERGAGQIPTAFTADAESQAKAAKLISRLKEIGVDYDIETL